MNLLRNFERRVADAFGEAPQGYAAPFSFKRLAKSAAREMEAETFVIDGIDTAPALYTILVSPDDDAAMRLLYPQLTDELVSFVKSEADRKGYAFVGEPLARFIVDPKLRNGKFSVFAENVDELTLRQLRAEEAAFLSGSSAKGGAAADISRGESRRKPSRRAANVQVQARAEAKRGTAAPPEATPAASVAAPGIKEIPTLEPGAAASAAVAGVVEAQGGAAAALSAAAAAPMPVAEAVETPLAQPRHISKLPSLDDPSSAGLDVVPLDFIDSLADPLPAPAAAPAPAPVPATVRRSSVPSVDDTPATEAEASCELVDHQTGRTYTAQAPTTMIGRERRPGSIVLRDPNVSRVHAELSYDGRVWRIRDLGSTNGTLVNNVDVEQAMLRDGDILTIGLMRLEFREV